VDKVSNLHLPSGTKPSIIVMWQTHGVRGTDEPKRMKVRVLPAHRVLNRDVQTPKRVRLGNLNATPDGWINAQQFDPDLENVLPLLHGTSSTLLPN
jgi:hypothetical protein